MALLNLAPMFRFNERNNTGAPLVGGKLYTAQPGTVAGPAQSFPKAAYSDSNGTTPQSNPVILDGSGRAEIWLSGSYSIAMYDLNNVLVYSEPFVTGSGAITQASGIDTIQFFDATLATANVSILSANDAAAGPLVIVKTDNSANFVTITPTTGTILGQPSYSLQNQNESVRLVPQASSNDWKKGA